VKKLPPYGKELAERQRFKNCPDLVAVCFGADSWDRAKERNDSGQDFVAVVHPAGKDPKDFKWPVQHCRCVVEWSLGPSREQVLSLVRCLINSRAESVTVVPLFEDFDTPIVRYRTEKPTGERWVDDRESIQKYIPLTSQEAVANE